MIRKAKLLEIDKIITITQACAKAMSAQGILQWNEHYPNKQAFIKDFEREELFYLFSSETLIGCITISTFKDSEYNSIDWLTQDANQYYIHRLAVHPSMQGKGYARKLMDFAEDFAKSKNAISVRLDTFSQNKRNQRFYENRGYKKLGNIYFPKQSKDPFYCYELVL